jgi:hypothetical protein
LVADEPFLFPLFTSHKKDTHAMSLEMIFGTITAIGGTISLVFGGGLINRVIKHSNEMAVTRHILNEQQAHLAALVKEVAEIRGNSIEVAATVKQFAEQIKKLDQLPTVLAKLEAMETLVENVQALVTSLTQNRIQGHK